MQIARPRLVSVGVASASIFAAAAAAQPGTPYRIVDLGVLAPTIDSPSALAAAITNSPSFLIGGSPTIVGQSIDASGSPRPFLWNSNTMADGIAGLPGFGAANDISPTSATFVGSFTPAGHSAPRAFLGGISMGAVLFLPSLGGPGSRAFGVNDARTAVGSAQTPDGRWHASVWPFNAPTPIDLGTFGGSSGEALAINRFGQVVGSALNPAGVPRAFLHDPQFIGPIQIRDIGGLSPTRGSVARDVNNATVRNNPLVVVGQSQLDAPAGQWRATRWSWSGNTQATPTIINLGALRPSDPASDALGINARGFIVGYSGDPPSSSFSGDTRAFVWAGGTLANLNDQIPGVTQWRLEVAADVNDSGVVVGWGQFRATPSSPPQRRAFALFPIGRGIRREIVPTEPGP